MKRYLIHHDDGGTWNLVVEDKSWTVEHTLNGERRVYGLDEFEKSDDGARLARSVTLAVARADVT